MSQPNVTPGATAAAPNAAQTGQSQGSDPKNPATAAPGTEAPASAPEKQDPYAPRFAALSRQEKALREQQAAWKAQREAESKEWQAKIEHAKRVGELKTKAKTDRTAALELMKELDLSFDELTKLHLNGGKPTPEMIAEEARRRTEALEKQLEERDKKAKEDAQAREEAEKKAKVEQAVQGFKSQISEHLQTKPDDYELTLAYRDAHSGKSGVDLVYDVIDEHYNQTEKETGTGRVMSHEEASKIVEAWLEKDIEERYLSRKKIQAKLGQKPAADSGRPGGDSGANAGGAGGDAGSAASAGTRRSGPSLPSRTLTNADQTSVATPPATKPKTREESLREAAKLLRWSQG